MYKKTDTIFCIYGRNRIIQWHFLKILTWVFRGHCGRSMLNFEADDAKVLIYLTFMFYWTLVSNAKGNIAKSRKSELWNCLSYRGLPYLFENRNQTFRNNWKISRFKISLKIQHWLSFDLNDLKRPNWILFKKVME